MKAEFIWKDYEFIKKPKTKNWFLGAGLFFAIIMLIALFSRNYFLSFLIMVATFSSFLYALKEPDIYSFKISKKGIYIGKKHIPFEEIISFWIFDKEVSEREELSIITDKKINNNIKIPLGNQNANSVRRFLSEFINEEKQEESLIDLFLQRIGF